MWLQNKIYKFSLSNGNDISSKPLQSNVMVNKNKSDIKISDLFFGIKTDNIGYAKGYSILEFIDSNGDIVINDKLYNLSFYNDSENFTMSKMENPRWVLEDKLIKDDALSLLEKKIEEAGISSQPSDPPKQPQEEKTVDENLQEGGEEILSKEYELEKSELEANGFVELNTEPKSNIRVLTTGYDGDIVLIEINEEDFSILDIEDYNIDMDIENRTFSFSKNQ